MDCPPKIAAEFRELAFEEKFPLVENGLYKQH